MQSLEPRVAAAIGALFSNDEVEEARQLIHVNCTPEAIHSTGDGTERIRLAVLKLSGGNLEKLVEAIALAQTDYRDALMASGFGHDLQAHLYWKP